MNKKVEWLFPTRVINSPVVLSRRKRLAAMVSKVLGVSTEDPTHQTHRVMSVYAAGKTLISRSMLTGGYGKHGFVGVFPLMDDPRKASSFYQPQAIYMDLESMPKPTIWYDEAHMPGYSPFFPNKVR